MEYYIVEYEDRNDGVYSNKFKAENAIIAVSKFYTYWNCEGLGTKCISRADTIEEAIAIFDKFDTNKIHIVNIYTMGNWIYCTEVEDEDSN